MEPYLFHLPDDAPLLDWHELSIPPRDEEMFASWEKSRSAWLPTLYLDADDEGPLML